MCVFFTAVGEATPGASVQKPAPAASRQDIFAGQQVKLLHYEIH